MELFMVAMWVRPDGASEYQPRTKDLAGGEVHWKPVAAGIQELAPWQDQLKYTSRTRSVVGPPSPLLRRAT